MAVDSRHEHGDYGSDSLESESNGAAVIVVVVGGDAACALCDGRLYPCLDVSLSKPLFHTIKQSAHVEQK